VNIGVVAHTARRQQAETLARTIAASYVSIDNGTLGAEANHRKVWETLIGKISDWCVVVEDDALPVPDFRAQLDEALTVSPTPIVSLYLGRERPPHWQTRIEQAIHKAESVDACFITSNYLLHAVATAIRTPLLPSMLLHKTRLPWDEHLTAWATKHGHRIAYTTPSLVDHADTDTLIAHRDGQPRTPGRVAWQYGQRDNWTTSTIPM
jgi:GR25 family glycosyltransferase involved in LPS biosynthesis